MIRASCLESFLRRSSDRSRSLAKILAAALVASLSLVTAAWGQGPALEALSPPAFPTLVEVGIYSVEILDIDPRVEVFEVEADLHASWIDPRLAFNPNSAGTEVLIYQGASAHKALEERLWWPDFEITDARGSRDRMHVEVEVYSDGSVFYRERFVAKIKQGFNLGSFPYDSHEISFSIEPFSYNASTVQFVEAGGGGSVSWEPTEWVVDAPGPAVYSGLYCSDTGASCATDADCGGDATCDAGFANATVSMTIDRVHTYYFWKFLLPMCLIVLVSAAVFWLDLVAYPSPGDRLTIAFTSVLTVVAFDFVSSGDLPKLWYTTALDRLMIVSYVCLAVNIFENIVAVALVRRNPKLVKWMDRVFRIAFPAVFLFMVFVVVVSA